MAEIFSEKDLDVGYAEHTKPQIHLQEGKFFRERMDFTGRPLRAVGRAEEDRKNLRVIESLCASHSVVWKKNSSSRILIHNLHPQQ